MPIVHASSKTLANKQALQHLWKNKESSHYIVWEPQWNRPWLLHMLRNSQNVAAWTVELLHMDILEEMVLQLCGHQAEKSFEKHNLEIGSKLAANVAISKHDFFTESWTSCSFWFSSGAAQCNPTKKLQKSNKRKSWQRALLVSMPALQKRQLGPWEHQRF